ncbi:thioredoxin family protein [Dyadobacter psychrotolerans]|uniref:Thioredoxin family protein n=1 Tax=Dyadobacter psychrotolerans TaxID=2541721 RepID=A0A4R5DLW7_9BACT|nr:thioredoxin family protein [Dyadobacter psychrotolerans]TDE15256.1 thioredoxin family protein [Dyadobacter psychrotolerans]
MKLLSTIVLTIISIFGSEWKLDFSEAKSQAASEHKMILLSFSGSDWCGPCIKLTKDVFESTEFQTYASQKLVMVRADFPRQKKNQLEKSQVAKNEALAEKYNPKGLFPLTVLIDNKGNIVKEWEGYQPSIPNFIADIRSHSGSVN